MASGAGGRLSTAGHNLLVLILGGLLAGYVLAFFQVGGVPLLDYFLQVNQLVYAGYVWQLVTSVVIAPPGLGGIVDVGFNALALYFLDPLFATAYNSRQYYAVFWATAVAGNIFSLLYGPQESSFGASGGIFGLLAALVTYDLAVNRQLSLQILSWFLFVFVFSSFLLPGVDWLAHLGGSVLGFAMGYAIGSSQGQRDL